MYLSMRSGNFTAENSLFFQEFFQNPLKKKALCDIIYNDLMGILACPYIGLITISED